MKLLLVALLSVASTLSAAQITLDATYAGTRYSEGSPFTGGMGAGWCPCDPITEARSALVFDLTGVNGIITSAEVRLGMGVNSYLTPDSSETYNIHEVTSTIAGVTDGFANVPVYTDLGDGTLFGSVVVSAASEGTTVVIPLNAAGLAFLNGKTGQIAFGGAVSTLAFGGQMELVFAGLHGSLPRQLVLTVEPTAVPEPSAMLLTGAGLLSLLLSRRRNE